MIRKSLLFISLVLVGATYLLSSPKMSLVDLEGLENPQYLVAAKNFILIEDNYKVKMYAMKDFKLIKTIGNKGEGPGEFKSFAFPQILPDSIMISSSNKVGFYDFSGNLIKEKKSPLTTYVIRKIADKYISDRILKEADDFYIAYNIYDHEFRKIKEYYRMKWALHKDGRKDLFEIYFFDVYNNKIIFAHGEGFRIDILDKNGELLHSIELNPAKITFSDSDMDFIIKDLMENMKDKSYAQYIKNKTIQPEYYPAIRKCVVADGKIYVITYVKKDKLSECYIFDMSGKQLKRTFIPLRDTSPLMAPPFTISGGHLYQLVENEEKESWQLVISKITP